MSYLVLARKWRPKRFAELVGQEHVVRALTNALDTGRVHHAFLFTGTRGVGKTTIARIFAKSLNCEQGTSAEPCGECSACRDIDAGRFLDLLEIDAASNTGVDDVRDVIENAQYMPSRGRMKVYLIDEVHMLSKAAFNALLKTLEEPPGHVKFLLATTDPQKLPVTVLSRCLQFNLKRLDEAQISGQIGRILQAEGIAAEPGAIRQLSKAADGSLRDGLSLLDQAIAYTGAGSGAGSGSGSGAGSGAGNEAGSSKSLDDAAVAAMLGSVDRTRVDALLRALAEGDGSGLLAEVASLAEFSPDWSSVLEALSDALHRVQVRQLVPDASIEVDGVDVDSLAQLLRPELVQLWYQMAINGRRDIPLAPSPRAGFEMSVLRMLAFRPAGDAADAPAGGATSGADASARRSASPSGSASGARAASVPAGESTAPAPEAVQAQVVARSGAAAPDVPAVAPPPSVMASAPVAASDRPGPQSPPAPAAQSTPASTAAPTVGSVDAAPTRPPTALPEMAASSGSSIADADAWHDLVVGSDLKGPARLLAEHAGFVSFSDGVLSLSLPPTDQHLQSPVLVGLVADALAQRLGAAPQIRFEAASRTVESLHQRNERARDQRQVAAEVVFLGDPEVQRLMSERGARVVPDSIRPFDEV